MEIGDSVVFASSLRKKKGWKVVVILERPFDPVATTMLVELSTLDQGKEHVVVLVPPTTSRSSEDSREQVEVWRRETERALGVPSLGFPIICEVEEQFGFERGSMIVIASPDSEALWISRYPSAVGQNVEEVMRTLEALRMSHDHDVATAANWAPGRQDVFSDRGEVEIKPWFKLSACTSFTST